MSRQDKGDGTLWIATESFACELDGQQVTVQAGHTRVRDGHPLLRGHEQWFEPIAAHYEVEQATANPGQRRGERPS